MKWTKTKNQLKNVAKASEVKSYNCWKRSAERVKGPLRKFSHLRILCHHLNSFARLPDGSDNSCQSCHLLLSMAWTGLSKLSGPFFPLLHRTCQERITFKQRKPFVFTCFASKQLDSDLLKKVITKKNNSLAVDSSHHHLQFYKREREKKW